jgi:hypothetical protein
MVHLSLAITREDFLKGFIMSQYPQAIQELLARPCASYWLKDAIKSAFNRDKVDALNDAELLVKLLKSR